MGPVFFISLFFLSPMVLAEVQPLSLEVGLDLALQNSRNVKSEKASVDAAQEEISKANADFFPTLNLIGDTGTYHDRVPQPGDSAYPTVPRDRNVYQARLEIKEVLFSGFSTAAAVQSAKASKSVEEKKLNMEKQNVRSDFIKSYFGIQWARKKLASENEILDLKKSRLGQVQNRRNSGRATELETLQSQLAVQSQEPRINSLKATLENFSLHLNQLVGSTVKDQYRLTDEIEGTARKLDHDQKLTLTEAFEKAVAKNDNLQVLESQSERLTADLKLEDAKSLPTISVRGFGGLDTYMQNEIGGQNATVYGFLVELNAPLFSGFSTIYNAQEKRSKIESVTELRSKAREDLLETLQQTFRQIEVNRENVKTGELNVQVARRTVIRADALYSAGRATLTDSLDAYSQRLSAEEDLVDNYYHTIQTLADLKRLVGE
jgi:outer membrane protein